MREPTLKSDEPNPETVEQKSTELPQEPTRWERAAKITIEVYHECAQRPKYIFCFICLLVSRLVNVLFSTYFQLWVMSFQNSGVLESNEESDSIYANIIIGSQVVTLITLPIFGFYSDRLDSRAILPAAFFLRGIIAASFYFIEDPGDW